MSQTLYDKVVEYVNTSFQGKNVKHFERTAYWMEKFLPIFSEAQKIAAYSHDIERAFRDKSMPIPENYLDKTFLKMHQEKGAKIIGEFLSQNGADGDLIQHVEYLVSKHEVGGDAEQNAIMDADSVSFFETNAAIFVNERATIQGYKKVKEKLDWMFNRISSEEHKKFAQDNYEKWSEALEAFKS